MTDNVNMIFRKVGGIWLRVDSREPKPPTLADCLNYLKITIDEDTQFCRIKRYTKDICVTIIYRAYNEAKITINIHTYKWKNTR